jgi:hypothetical protein
VVGDGLGEINATAREVRRGRDHHEGLDLFAVFALSRRQVSSREQLLDYGCGLSSSWQEDGSW